MAAPRATSFRALRTLSQQSRSLHMTGPANYSSSLLSSSKSSSSTDDIADLRAECKRRNLPFAGSKAELLARLEPTRALSSTSTSRPAPFRPTNTRPFNTSRALKTPKDTSTIDFAYLPMSYVPDDMAPELLRVPLLPQNFAPDRSGVHAHETPEYDAVGRQEIFTAAADSTHITAPSSMHEGVDGAVDAAVGAIRETKARVAASVGGKEEGIARTIFRDMAEDLFGNGKVKAGAA